ncbi:MAG: c-type cytochrome [Proteobacteria bacterium]|nr:c-type cytochrome [Pseudomonadota bacterium]
MTRILLWTLPSLLVSHQLMATAQVGQYEQADIAYGSTLYATYCVVCHGESGDLFPGVNLRSGVFRHAASDRDLRGILLDGIPGTTMVAGAYEEAELVALVAYLRNMDAEIGGVVLGDAARGQALFEGRGDCGSCHRVAGQGPRFAPDLSDIGAVRSAAVLSRALQDPHGSGLPMNRAVRAVTADGSVINGRRMNEDTYSVQLIDEQERLLSLDKSDLREYAILESWDLPSYAGVFSEEEVADLMAYLRSLKGVN